MPGKDHLVSKSVDVSDNRPAGMFRFGRVWRVALAVLVLVALFYFDALEFDRLIAVFSATSAVATALLCVLGAIHLAILRWWILLRSQGVHAPLGKLWHLTFMGGFANVFLPGGIGGDALRMYYVRGLAGPRAARAILSVAADRIIGLAGLILACTLIVVFYLGRVTASVELRELTLVVILVAAAGIALFLSAFALGHRASFRRRLRALAPQHTWFGRMLGLLIDVAGDYHRNIGAVLACVVISVVAHGLMVGALIVLMGTVDLPELGWANAALAGLLSFLANVLPLTPGGLGVGEGVFDQICRLLSGAPAGSGFGSVFFALRAVSYAATLPGLISFAVYQGGTQ